MLRRAGMTYTTFLTGFLRFVHLSTFPHRRLVIYAVKCSNTPLDNVTKPEPEKVFIHGPPLSPIVTFTNFRQFQPPSAEFTGISAPPLSFPPRVKLLCSQAAASSISSLCHPFFFLSRRHFPAIPKEHPGQF